LKNFLFLLVFLICFTKANSQNPYLDSLKRSLAVAREDTTRVLLLSELSLYSIFSNPDTSLALAKQGIRLAQQINYSKGEAYCKRSVGFVFWSIGDYTTAIKMAFLIMPYAEASNDINLQLWLTALLLNAYKDNGDYNEAIKYDLKGRMITQKLHQPIEAKTEMMLANIYYDMNQLDSAQHYIRLSLNKGGISDGATCLLTGKIQVKFQQPDSAFYYFKLGIATLKTEKNFKDLADAYQSIAALYFSDGHTDSAIYHAQNGLALAQQKSFVKEQFNLTSFLAAAYEKKNTDSAFRYYKLAMKAKDSLFNREKVKQGLSFQFNEELRQREIQSTEMEYRNKVRTYLFIAGLAVFVIIALLQWRNNRHKQRAYRLLEKQKAKTDETLTDLKAAQSQLIQSEKMASLGELTAGIAHEIQNPLNFVNNFSEVNKEMLEELKAERLRPAAERDEQTESEIIEDVIANSEKINHHGKRADSIVKGMLQHSQTSTGKKEPTNINALADEYLRLSYHGLRAKDKSFNATLNTAYDETIGSINIIPQDIGKVLLNLFNNAFYAVNETNKKAQPLMEGEAYEPLVTVTTRRLSSPLGDGGKIEIHVSDNGNGIPQKILDKIFQPFFTTKPTGQGTGLGLSLSYDIIKAHGGEIKVETKEGEGTEFIIQLPIV